MNYRNLLLFFAVLFCITNTSLAQTYSDGPIQLQMRVRDVQINYANSSSSSDFNLNIGSLGLSNFSDDEFTIKLWGRDLANTSGLGWQGGNCLQETLPMLNGGPETTQDYNYSLFNFTYPGTTVPQLLQLKIDAWEDDIPTDFAIVSGLTACGSSGTRCDFNPSMCCINFIGCLFSESDDERCAAEPFASINYRVNAQNAGIPPCQWYSHGYITGSGCANNNYHPKIETFWRYTKGTSCTPTAALDLGTLNTSNTLVHYNSNECYSNNFATGGGNDVFYTFDIAANQGVQIQLVADCPASVIFNTQIYLLDANCTVTASATGTCGVPAAINKALCAPGRYYVVMDGASSTDVGAFTLSITEDPSFTFTATTTKTDVTCNAGTNGAAVATPNGGSAPYTFAWPNSLPADSALTGLVAGSYTVTVTDFEGCTASSTAVVGQPAAMVVTVSTNDVSCGGANDGSATAVVTGGTQPYNYTWNTSPVQTGANAVLLGQGTFTVIVSDVNSCPPVSQTGTVNQSTTIIVTVDAVNNVNCNGANDGSISQTISGGATPYTFTWSNSLPATEDQINLGPGTYTVTITDASQCFETATYVITEPSALVTTVATVKDASCASSEDGSADIDVTGGTPPYTYNWSDGSSFGVLLDVVAGSYTVTVTDDNGCTITQAVIIAGPTNPLTATITATGADCSQSILGSADLTVSGGATPYSFFWSSFVTTEDASNLTAGTYSVVISDDNGCTLIDTVTIAELATGGSCNGTGTDTVGVVLPYFVPNVFTPNGDGQNDIFLVFVKEEAKTNIRIFNRFGGQVYFNGNLNTVYGSTDGWNGSYKDKDADEATYVYMINIDYVDPNLEDEQLTGSITLIR